MSDIYIVNFKGPGRGMFSIVNDLVDHLYVADKMGYKLSIQWKVSTYKPKPNDEDGFKSYFKDFFNFNNEDRLVGSKGIFAFRKGNLITPRQNGLALPRERATVNRIIEKYIHLHEPILAKIESFRAEKFSDFTIGLHIRGKGRTDGGAAMPSTLDFPATIAAINIDDQRH